MAKTKRKKLSAKAFTIVIASLLAVLIAISVAIPCVLVGKFDAVMRDFFGTAGRKGGTAGGNAVTDKLDKVYNMIADKEGMSQSKLDECPLSALESGGVLDSAKNTKAMFVISRTGGEGRDLARYMGKFTDIAADKAKHYLEPDSVELGIIDYLNKNFRDVVILVNTNNAFELGWVENYENISAVMWAPGGGGETANSIVDVLTGKVATSGHLPDTFAFDALSSPVMQNMGDIALTVGGKTTEQYGVSYDEGIYVGYKYYETRYFDKVSGQGNAGEYDYAAAVQYPFGYGLSYTDFTWSNFEMTGPDADGIIKVTVNVKNNSTAVTAKDVVQVYVNAPYTEFDNTNKVEKSAAALVGFAKTKALAPGADETVEIDIDVAVFVVYDDVVNKTYIPRRATIS